MSSFSKSVTGYVVLRHAPSECGAKSGDERGPVTAVTTAVERALRQQIEAAITISGSSGSILSGLKVGAFVLPSPPSAAGRLRCVHCRVGFSFNLVTSGGDSAAVADDGLSFPQLLNVTVADAAPQVAAVYYAVPNTTAAPTPLTATPAAAVDETDNAAAAAPSSPITATAAPSAPSSFGTKRLLVVGAGGIGCELMKALILAGFRQVILVDLDTIDATNLNRQFLFRKKHVGMPKAEVVAEAVTEWYTNYVKFLSTSSSSAAAVDAPPPLSITPICGNIKNADGPFDLDFFKSFDLILNGLDNVSARKHVNRMAMQAEVRLVESGTAGYNGQVQPIVRNQTACYDCVERPPDQKSFAVCTIHARPTTMVHCVHYAKELYDRLFGANPMNNHNSGAASATPAAAAGGTAAAAPAAADEMQFLADIANSGALATLDGANTLLSLLFVKKVEELLAMKAASTWTNGKPPIALADAMATMTASSSAGSMIQPADDFKIPSVEEAMALAQLAIQEAAGRIAADSSASRSAFKKEDRIAVRFVTAMANLRASCFHINRDSLHELTTIAGSIVPAIATTNAMIASCVANVACLMLSPPPSSQPLTIGSSSSSSSVSLPFVYVRKAPQTRRRKIPVAVATPTSGSSSSSAAAPSAPSTSTTLIVKDELLIHSVPPPDANPKCLICSDNAARVITCRLNATLYTLNDFIKLILRDRMSLVAPTVSAGASILYEYEEFESLGKQPLTRWVGGGGVGNSAAAAEKDGGAGASSPSSTIFTIGDLYQTVEWTMQLYHEGEQGPFYRSDLMHYCLDNTEATSEEERRMGGGGGGAATAATTNNKAVPTTTVAAVAVVSGGKHDRNGNSTEAVVSAIATTTATPATAASAAPSVASAPIVAVTVAPPVVAAPVDEDDDDIVMVVDGPSSTANKKHKSEPMASATPNTTAAVADAPKVAAAADDDDDIIELD